MKHSNHVKGIQKLQLGALILLCLIGGVACGGSGSSSTPNTPSTNPPTQPQGLVSGGSDTQNPVSPVIAVVQQKSAGPRKGVCWNGRTQLREAKRQRLRNNANRSCGAVDYQRKLKLLLVAN